MSLIPMVLSREENSERVMDLYSRLLKDRIIMVTGPIEPNMANIIKAQLLFLEAEDANADITMYIDSPGGEVATGMGIFDTMNFIQPDINTICVGMAASMASLILAAGTKGKRYALPNSEIMIHQPSGGSQGQATDMQIAVKHIMHTKSKLHGIYSNITQKSLEEISRDMERDYWFTAEKAVEYGLIDKILLKRGESF